MTVDGGGGRNVTVDTRVNVVNGTVVERPYTIYDNGSDGVNHLLDIPSGGLEKWRDTGRRGGGRLGLDSKLDDALGIGKGNGQVIARVEDTLITIGVAEININFGLSEKKCIFNCILEQYVAWSGG